VLNEWVVSVLVSGWSMGVGCVKWVSGECVGKGMEYGGRVC